MCILSDTNTYLWAPSFVIPAKGGRGRIPIPIPDGFLHVEAQSVADPEMGAETNSNCVYSSLSGIVASMDGILARWVSVTLYSYVRVLDDQVMLLLSLSVSYDRYFRRVRGVSKRV